MAIHTINDDILGSPQAEQYFTRADRRVMIGMRATLELLKLPLPDYAKRKPAGQRTRAGEAVAQAYAGDMPLPERRLREVRHGRAMLPVLNDRKPNASPERVAAAKARQAQRLAGAAVAMPATDGEAASLFAQTFGGRGDAAAVLAPNKLGNPTA